jgi:uncharacterized membrane protein
MTRTPEDLITDYLGRLERELADLPRARRREVVEEISEHIEEAGAHTEVETLNVLERLGDPAEIAAEARARFGIEPRRSGPQEVAALVLLLVGGFLFGIGWFVGLVLLWSSDVWSIRDKVIGTLVFPGGLAVLPFLFAFSWPSYGEGCIGGPGQPTVCTGGPSSAAHALATALLVVLVVGPFLTTLYLSRRLRSRSRVALA